jgi:tRNA-dihydrouridine synthase
MAQIWRSVFPDLLTLLCFAFWLVMVVAEMLGTVDLVEKDTDTVVFWTFDKEKSPVVFQIGTSDAVQAVQAANLGYVCHSYLFAYMQRTSSDLLLHFILSYFWMASCNYE